MRKIFVLFFVMMVALEAVAATKEAKEHMQNTVLVFPRFFLQLFPPLAGAYLLSPRISSKILFLYRRLPSAFFALLFIENDIAIQTFHVLHSSVLLQPLYS